MAGTPPAEPHGQHGTAWSSVRDVGMAEDKNARHRRTMEDQHVIVDRLGGRPDWGYFAIYDGHGGRAAAEYAAKHLHEVLVEELEAAPADSPAAVEAALGRAFVRTDRGISDAHIQFGGATAVAAVVMPVGDRRTLFVANAGDARAVLRVGARVERLSYDHKASDEAESQRVQAAGGFIMNGRVNGMLAVTRSLGDSTMKEYIISQPRVVHRVIADHHVDADDAARAVLVLACDGVWDVVEDDAALEVACAQLAGPHGSAQSAAEKLLITSLRNGSTDNVSVMVIAL